MPREAFADGPTGEFSEPLAERPDELFALLNVLEPSRTVGNCQQVDWLEGGWSAFGHDDAGRAVQIAG